MNLCGHELCSMQHSKQAEVTATPGNGAGSHHSSSGHRQPFVLCQVVGEVGEQHPPGQAAEQPLDEDQQVGGHPQ